MSKESNDVADLRRFAISLSDELEIVSEEVVRLMHCLDAYQMVLEGCASPTEIRRPSYGRSKTRSSRLPGYCRPSRRPETGTSASSWSTSFPYCLHLVDQAARNQEEQRQLRRRLPEPPRESWRLVGLS